MKNTKKHILLAFILLTISYISHSQNFNLSDRSSIIVSGTSNLHDWDIEAENFTGHIKFSDFESAKISGINIIVNSESLLSGKKGMDKNTFKALKTDFYPNILFKTVKIESIKPTEDNIYKVTSIGNLTIGGITKKVKINLLLIKNNMRDDLGSCLVLGSYEIDMTDYNIEPPKALLGTIRTGELVTIKFNVSFIKE